jgi:hypothetical protein
MSTPRPNEFPEGSDSGGGGRVFRPRPNPGEIPWERRALQSVIMQEVLQLRDRVHGLESRLLITRYGGGGASSFYNPAEYPEGGEGGGEIVEIADIPGEIIEIAELQRVNVASEVTALRQQFASFEQRMTGQIEELKQQIGKQR